MYAVPVTVRNSYPSTRTILSVASNDPGSVVSGLVGTTLAPGEVALGFVNVSGSALGSRDVTLTVAFDAGQG